MTTFLTNLVETYPMTLILTTLILAGLVAAGMIAVDMRDAAKAKAHLIPIPVPVESDPRAHRTERDL